MMPHSITTDTTNAADGSNAIRHLAVIMDGNGRWAESRGLPRLKGHQQGAEALRRTLKAAADAGISWLTVYAFSAENWQRPKQEVTDLMGLLKFYIGKEVKALHKENIRLRFIGDRARLSDELKAMLEKAEQTTEHNSAFNLNIALSYGSKQELTHAMKQLAQQVAEQRLTPEDISEQHIEAALHTSGMPAPDLLIRTGGEQRLSNFLLWQLAYTELYFTDILWPDFAAEHLQQAIEAYSQRERRYGTTN